MPSVGETDEGNGEAGDDVTDEGVGKIKAERRCDEADTKDYDCPSPNPYLYQLP